MSKNKQARKEKEKEELDAPRARTFVLSEDELRDATEKELARLIEEEERELRFFGSLRGGYARLPENLL